MPVHVLTVIEDLLLRPGISAQLKAAGLTEARLVPDVPVAEQVPPGAEAVGLVDLDARGGDPLAPVRRLLEAGVPVIGYCGHADAATRARAVEAGVTLVAARSEVHGGLPILVGKALARAAGG